MNTRLQVEHPVTEATTGLDLVELQLQVADGGRLDRRTAADARAFDRGPAVRRGPGQGLAAAGRHRAPLRGPDVRTEFGRSTRAGVRVDSGVVDGSEVSVFYDPMLAKVISYAPTRPQAAACWPTRWPAPGCTASAPTATCWSTCCAIPHSSTAPPTPRSSTPTAWPSWPRRWPTAAPRAVGAGRRSGRCCPEPQGRNGARRSAQRMAQSGVGLPDQALQRRRRRRRTRCDTGSAAVGVELPDHDDVDPGVRDARTGSCWPSTAWTGRSTSPATETDVFVDSPLGPGATRRAAALPRSRMPPSRRVRCSPRCPARCCASAPRSATPSRPASR